MELQKQEIAFAVLMASATFFALALFIIIAYAINFRLRARRFKELLEKVVETQERERTRIAEDLHDEISPLLSAVKLQVSTMYSEQETNSSLHDTYALIDAAMSEIRIITRNLAPLGLSKNGLIKELEEYLKIIQRTKTIIVNYSHSGIGRNLKPEVELNIYRIILEMINNTLKYAECKTIDITLNADNINLKIVYHDDGKGFNDADYDEGMGLRNIRDRVKFLKGDVRLETSDGMGTSFHLLFDINHLIARQHE